MCEDCKVQDDGRRNNDRRIDLSECCTSIDTSGDFTTKRIEEIRNDLINFSKENQIKSLQDRISRGLNVTGMLAIPEFHEDIKKICAREGTTIEDLQKMVLDIQQNGAWEYSNEFSSAINDDYVTILGKSDEDIRKINTAKAYLILNKIDEIGGRESDMTPQEFLTEFSRIQLQIKDVAENGRSKIADLNNYNNSILEFINDCPVVHGNDFLPVALNGMTYGVLQDKDGMLFIGSKEPIDLSILEKFGLKKVEREERGRNVTFYVNDSGDEILKHLYPGFVIVLNKNMELATNIATRSYDAFNNDTFCHKVFAPTSQSGDLFLNCPLFKDEVKEHIFKEEKFKEILDEVFPKPKERDLVNLSNAEKMACFLEDLINIKGRQIVMDCVIDNAIRKISRSKSPEDKLTFQKLVENIKRYEEDNTNKEAQESVKKILLTILTDAEKEFEKSALQHHLRQTKKMEEVERILSFSRKYISKLTEQVCIQDMAGGAGDLGLAMAYEFMLQGKSFSKLQIVDPAPDLDRFFSIIVSELPKCYGFKKLKDDSKLEFLKATLQGATVSADSFVIAKHPCGTLADEIIDLCRREKPQFMCMMTCCQSKAATERAKYGFTQNDWAQLCKLTDARESAKVHKMTYSQAQIIAQKAQDIIDSARYRYLSGNQSFDSFYNNEEVTYNCAKGELIPKSHVLGFFREDESSKLDNTQIFVSLDCYSFPKDGKY